MTRKTSFYYSFLVLPKAKREVIVAVWDFCRAVDDAVDLESDPVKARVALEEWRAEVARVFEGTPRTPQGVALKKLAAPFSLPRAEFDALVDGVGMDITPQRFRTFEELVPYCHRVASSVGLICAEIFGYRDPVVREYARDLGVALQLTNILRDVAVDFAQQRLYIPIDDMTRFGVSEDDIARECREAGAGVTSPAVRALLECQAKRAHEFFAKASRELPAAERRAVLAAEIMRAIYEETLRRIEAEGFDVFSRVIRVRRVTQARIAAGVLWDTTVGRSH
ncbi:MAG: squalene synthase HpnD [Acidobacteria bacterium]|nr:MAG: squalene synthase HpnD [Acidobacteriota bacterium]